MAGVYNIQSLETGLYIFDDGQVNTSVILTKGPAVRCCIHPTLGS